MISRRTIDRVFDLAQVDEVVGEFVNLKKRGANLLGLCPFHDEKTPSFTVSPSKGIYKCFGCGAAGNSITFLKEHENLTFPESVKWLAKKYQIEIEETEQTDEDKEQDKLRESLIILNEFARDYFVKQLYETETGQAIGLSYFKERGFTDEVIKKFQLGFTQESYDGFTKHALESKFNLKVLEQAGLTKVKEGKRFDFFRGRVQFTIHNLSGRPVAFAGRILKTDVKAPKYVNSPETEVYNKSRILYGTCFAKTAIRKEDVCFLVEGYTDVISMHQAGIENVVASSGTSLTVDQVRLIKRFTDNITILYDGDAAGIKAATRGLEIVLEQGLNVKIVLLPEGEDPDSFVRSMGATKFLEFVNENAQDFILFKASGLAEGAKNDPVKKSALITEMVETIALIRDRIKRQIYIRECSELVHMPEDLLVKEVNRVIRQKIVRKEKLGAAEALRADPTAELPARKIPKPEFTEEDQEQIEHGIVRLLLELGNWDIEEERTVAQVIISEMESVRLENDLLNKIMLEVAENLENGVELTAKHFLNHTDQRISGKAIEILHPPYELSENWFAKHQIVITERKHTYKKDFIQSLCRFKLQKVQRMLEEVQEQLKKSHENEDEASVNQLLQEFQQKRLMRDELCKIVGTVVIR